MKLGYVQSAVVIIVGWLSVALVGFIAFFSSWATYRQLGYGLTYVTLPGNLLLLLLLVYFPYVIFRRALVGVDYLAILFFCLALATVIWAESRINWRVTIYWYMQCIVVFLAARFFVTNKSRVALVVLFALLGAFFGMQLIDEKLNSWGVVESRQGIDGINENYSAYVLAGALYLFVVVTYIGWLNRSKLLLFVVATYLIYGVSLLGTRGALISMVILLMLYLVFDKLPRSIYVYGVTGVYAVTLLFSFGAFNVFVSVLELFARGGQVFSGRDDIWTVAYGLVWDSAFLGIGVGSFMVVNPIEVPVHNIFLALMLDVGLLGFVLYVIMLFLTFKPIFSNNKTRKQIFVFSAYSLYWLPIAATGEYLLSPFSWALLAISYNLIRNNDLTQRLVDDVREKIQG